MSEILRAFRFKGGIHPEDEGKELSCHKAVQTAPLLAEYLVPVSQNAGKVPEIIVKKGDHVAKYQKIAAASGFVSADLHSPTSGEVAEILRLPGATGVPGDVIRIISDGEDKGEIPFAPIPDWQNAAPETLLSRVKEAGLTGMGGASFPTAVKLSVPPEKKVDTLILNGSECEPYLTADHRLMAEQPEKVLQGGAMLARILKVTNIFIAIEENKPDAIEAIGKFASAYGIKVVVPPVRYPQGSEKQLIQAVTRRKVPVKGLPADAGCVVQNVGTAAAFAEAVLTGVPLIQRIVTVTGKVVKKPGNFLCRIGTPVLEAVRMAGGVTEEPGKLILGGPMMGFAQQSFDLSITKNTSGILLLPVSESQIFESSGCLRCGRCVRGCPMNLLPCLLCSQIEGNRFDLAAKNHLMECIECGACAYDCPAHRPLVQLLRRGKAELRKKR